MLEYLIFLWNWERFFCLFLAPPAWGKTQLIKTFWQTTPVNIVYVSPLRALANEFYGCLKESFPQRQKDLFLIHSQKESIEFAEKLKERKAKGGNFFLIGTPETLSEKFFEEVERKSEKILVIMDEYHLWFEWGDSFRPLLWENFFRICNLENVSFLGLSATLSEKQQQWTLEACQLNFDSVSLINGGNYILKYPPSFLYSFYFIPSPSFFLKTLLLQSKGVLVFLPFRQQVLQWHRWALKNGLCSLYCLGGETTRFQEELAALQKQTENPLVIHCIFSTIALGHGVNLPEIEKVIIFFKEKNPSFWIQMVGRGGRRGAPYQAFVYNSFLPVSSRFKTLKKVLSLFLQFFLLQSLRICKCFLLRDLFYKKASIKKQGP